MKIFSLGEIVPLLDDKVGVLEAVRQGFVTHSRGGVELPVPMQMIFKRDGAAISGDCHVKAATASDLPYFCIKVASGFYDNPRQGLPVNSGLVMLLSSQTGQPLALFQDGGCMTSVRTAAAGALSAQLGQGSGPKRLGLLGTGHQAELQAIWISSTMDIEQIYLWGRAGRKAEALAAKLDVMGLRAVAVPTVRDLSSQSDILVTATPATVPILMAGDVRDGQHIIALGADSPGKRELDPQILVGAEAVIVDDLSQCVAHGELGWAVRSALMTQDTAFPLGQALAQSEPVVTGSGVSVVDLTGLGTQDLALASFVYQKLIS